MLHDSFAGICSCTAFQTSACCTEAEHSRAKKADSWCNGTRPFLKNKQRRTSEQGGKTVKSVEFYAIFAFNKVSRAIWHLLVHGLHILTCVFYDDFPCFEVYPLTALTARVLDTFFNILGWKHAVQGKKATDFSLEMQAFGIQYNLGKLWEGKPTVQNKPGRRDRVKSLTTELRKLGSGSRSAAASLAGILNFCGGFVLGHALKPATHALSKWSMGANLSTAATHEMCDMIEFLIDASKPRLIAMDRDLPSIVVYTDGAFEAREGVWGALVLDPETGVWEVYHGWVPTTLLEFWLRKVGDQIICEVEMYAYLCVRWACRRSWTSRCGICFIDNEACRLGFIKRSSPSDSHVFAFVCYFHNWHWDSFCCLDGEGALSVKPCRPPLTTKGWWALQAFGCQGLRINRAACRTFDFLNAESLWLPTSRSGALWSWSWLSWLKDRGKERANSKNALETVFLDATLAHTWNSIVPRDLSGSETLGTEKTCAPVDVHPPTPISQQGQKGILIHSVKPSFAHRFCSCVIFIL